MDFKPAISALNDELIALRRDFHRHPEIGFQEVRTSKIVEDYLTELGLEVRRCAGTGVIGVLRGAKSGKTVLNADSAENFAFSGSGWGHGVGLSQYGAMGMANAGFGYEEILRHYFGGNDPELLEFRIEE